MTARRRRIDWRERTARVRHVVRVSPNLTLSRVLDTARGRTDATVYLVGRRPGGSVERFLDWATAPDGWTAAGHWLGAPSRPVLRYSNDLTGQTVEVHRAASWFGEGDYSTVNVAHAFGLLERVARQQLDDGAAVLATPATTGRDWIARMLPTAGVEVLPEDVQHVIRSTSGQGRWQLFTADDERDTLPGLYGYDMRFGYAALCSGLPVAFLGDGPSVFEPYARARWRVRVRITRGWDRLGLLGVYDNSTDAWRWPDTPGEEFETWCDGAELRIVQQQGWHFTVLDSLRFREGKPLNRWAAAVRAMRDDLAALHGHPDYDPADVALAAGAARMVLVAAIGALHAKGTDTTETLPVALADRVPAHATDVRLDGDTVTYRLPAPPSWRQMAHPEWSAAIWARCRARLLDHRGTGALHVAPSELVALRQDAIYMTSDPGWPDDGSVGAMRRTLAKRGPVPTPRTTTELMEVRA